MNIKQCRTGLALCNRIWLSEWLICYDNACYKGGSFSYTYSLCSALRLGLCTDNSSAVLCCVYDLVLVDQIKEVQSGKTSEILRNKDIECMYQEEYMLTILYGNNYTPLDLVAKTPDEANIWIAGLSHLISKRDHLQNGCK